MLHPLSREQASLLCLSTGGRIAFGADPVGVGVRVGVGVSVASCLRSI